MKTLGKDSHPLSVKLGNFYEPTHPQQQLRDFEKSRIRTHWFNLSWSAFFLKSQWWATLENNRI